MQRCTLLEMPAATPTPTKKSARQGHRIKTRPTQEFSAETLRRTKNSIICFAALNGTSFFPWSPGICIHHGRLLVTDSLFVLKILNKLSFDYDSNGRALWHQICDHIFLIDDFHLLGMNSFALGHTCTATELFVS